MTQASRPERVSLRQLAFVFLRLGATAFGGPAAHIALMEEEVVRRRRWLSPEEYLDLLGAANLIPGPTSTEVAIHVGHRRAGVPGLLVSGVCFILPAALMVTALAAAYARAGRLPAVEALLHGVKPVVVAIVARALVGFFRSALHGKSLVAIAVLAAAAVVLGAGEITVLAAAGVAGWLARRRAGLTVALVAPLAPAARLGPDAFTALPALAPAAVAPAAVGPAAAAAPLALAAAVPVAHTAGVGLAALFATFVKIGAVLFGSGYVLLAFLRADLVQRLGWITEAQLLDAVAVGQITPGPLFTSATFIGFLVAGVPGAAVATVAIFLPAFVFVALSGPLLPRIRRSASAGAALDGVNAASVALMAVVSFELARAAIVDVPTALLAAAALAALSFTRVGSVWLMVAGAAVGLAVG
jgi:chromate transporter